MKKELVNNILSQIKDKHIKPKSKWIFKVRDYLIWTLAIISYLLASLIFAVILYFIIQNDWDLYSRLGNNFIGFIFITLPYMWLILITITIAATYYNVRHTKRGYRFPLSKMILVSIAATIIAGGLFYQLEAGEAIDDRLSASVPMYTKYINRRVFHLTNPEKGILAGRIIRVQTPEKFDIIDIGHNTWQIEVVREPKFVPLIEIRKGNKVKVIGKIVEENKFQAERIMPLGPGREMFRRINIIPGPLEEDILFNFPGRK